MAINTNVNNNAAVVVVGRTAPVPTGQQSSEKSIPVVIASDQEAIPVEEQNKQQSEVALSLLGIPRSEVALGIFADVNTYDVNPSEWSATPEQTVTVLPNDRSDFDQIPGSQDWGLTHVPSEAGALIEAPPTESAILTSKRFFRYQPGRVSAGTFGVKFGRSPYTTITSAGDLPSSGALLAPVNVQVRHPSVKKYGVFDKFDGYYFESINESRGDNFCCVRRSQSLIQQKSQTFFYSSTEDGAEANVRQFGSKQFDDYGNMELPGQYYRYHGDAVILRDGLVNIHAALFDASLLKEKRTIDIGQITPDNEIILDTVEYAISNFSYNNVTGRATVTTVGDHGFKEGDSVTLKDILLTCNTGAKLYPNKYSRKYFQIESISGSTLTVHVGVSDKDGVTLPDGTTFTNNSVTGGKVRELTSKTTESAVSILNIERLDPGAGSIGLLEITTTTDHNLLEGDHIEWTAGATWDNNGTNNAVWPLIATNENSYAQQKIYQVRQRKGDRQFIIQVGDEAFTGKTGFRLDEGATYNVATGGAEIQKITGFTEGGEVTISVGTYTASTGIMELTVNSISGLSVGDTIRLSDIATECSYNSDPDGSPRPPKIYPAKDDEDTYPIINVTSDTFQFDLFPSTIIHTHTANTGRVSNLGLRKGSGVYYYKNGQNTEAVDGGIYYVDSILGPRVKLTTCPNNAADPSLFAPSDFDAITLNTTPDTFQYKLTPTNVVYTPNDGLMVVTTDTTGLQVGDKVRFDDYSLAFTCDLDIGNGPDADVKFYPRPYNSTPAGGASNIDPASGKFLSILAVDSTTFTVQVLSTVPSTNQNDHTFFADFSSANSITVEKVRPYLITPAPFILPKTIQNQYSGTFNENFPDDDDQWTGVPFGCFPYKYEAEGNIYGYIGTNINLTNQDNAEQIRSEIDLVNNSLLNEWVYNHVNPIYWTVYEYRVPRSRFSGEKVDGQPDNDVLYSDVVFSAGLQRFPGQAVTDPATSANLTRTSNWNLNPENVTMYKIEFSWYGAVGALFLAYVPLDSGEARWVRVHHLRASNQLKVSSLGNPTLPITYLVYGGGTERSYGYLNSKREQNYVANSSSFSEYLVKYGASYYIDGGDRGTVRLFNYATPTTGEIFGNKIPLTITNADEIVGDTSEPYIDISTAFAALASKPTIPSNTESFTYFMNATVITPTNVPNVRVRWVEVTGGEQRLYLSKAIPSGTNGTGTYTIVLDRPKPIIGLKCREAVNGVRNRIQVYPTRLSIGNSGKFATIKLVKSPKFQTKDVHTGNFLTTYTTGDALNIGSIGKPAKLNSTRIDSNSTEFLNELGSTYGYFKGFNEGSNEIITIFGLLSRDASGIYSFSADQKTNTNLLIFGNFLRAGEFSEPTTTSLDKSAFTPTSTPLAALSAISISDEQRTPIPGTGQQITTIFTPANSGEQFELQQFFDYNKDYLSFPLTNEIETLFILGSENSQFNTGNGITSSGSATTITAAITWEEQ